MILLRKSREQNEDESLGQGPSWTLPKNVPVQWEYSVRRRLYHFWRLNRNGKVPKYSLYLEQHIFGSSFFSRRVNVDASWLTLTSRVAQQLLISKKFIEDDDDTIVDTGKELSLEQKLELVITKQISANQNTIQKSATCKTIRREIDLFENKRSRERSFKTKNVPDEFKGEILLNLLGEKAENILVYVKDEEISDYNKLKSLVLREFEPTPLICLQNFQKAKRMPNETHVQLASRLLTNWDQYCNLRNVNDFNSLKELIVSDKLYETLDNETAVHINIKTGAKLVQTN
ncbi:transposon Ty3-G Gag-Pol polyprotein [Trichonephila clavipes]|nr:transposon Ty3-G Gag-Pol polyprotein [Trichonephila clavipes]